MKRCPACGGDLLGDVAETGVRQCTACFGYLVDGQATLRLMMDARGLDIEALRQKIDDGNREYACPSCAGSMRVLIVQLDVIDLCFGCGTMFLDRREASRVSRGLIGVAEETAPS